MSWIFFIHSGVFSIHAMPTNNYPLQWFDDAISITFKADESLSASLTPARCQPIIEQVKLETQHQKLLLKEKSFELTRKRQRRYLRMYHQSLVLLYDRASRNQQFWHGKSKCIETALHVLKEGIIEILDTFQTHSLNLPARCKRVTSPSLQKAQKQLLSSLTQIKTAFSGAVRELRPLEILMENLIGISAHEPGVLTESDLEYQQCLLSALRQMPIHENLKVNEQNLLGLLIYFNFNSPEFMNYYTDKVYEQSSQVSGFPDQMARLLFSKKQFNQMPKHPALVFDKRYASLEKQISNWFEQEIAFLTSREALHHSPAATPIGQLPADPFKVVCFLSVDQIALLLRSMDGLRIFQAKSLKVIMQSIAPFLSTPVRADISWQSLRTKSYAPEDKDRQTAIKTLQAMIKWIQEY